MRSIAAHAESCRAVRFSTSGEQLFTASLDKSITAIDTATGAVVARLEGAHPAGINRLATLSDSLLASGDDDGLIRLWDPRSRAAVASLEAHEDFVADLTYAPDAAVMISVSGDGTLAAWDMRRHQLLVRGGGPQIPPPSTWMPQGDLPSPNAPPSDCA